MKRIVCFILLTALSAYAADNITGKWSGHMHVSASGEQDHDVTAVLVLQQNGSELTGTLTPTGKDPAPIQKGRVDGNKISLEVPGANPSIKLDGEVSDGTLKLTAEFMGKFAD